MRYVFTLLVLCVVASAITEEMTFTAYKGTNLHRCRNALAECRKPCGALNLLCFYRCNKQYNVCRRPVVDHCNDVYTTCVQMKLADMCKTGLLYCLVFS